MFLSHKKTEITPYKVTYKDHFDDEIFFIGTLESIVFCGMKQNNFNTVS